MLASDDSLLTFLLLNDVVLKGVLNPLFATDTNEMQEILRGKGIRIRNDDPIFTLLALNGIVLRNSVDLALRAKSVSDQRREQRPVAEHRLRQRWLLALVLACFSV